MAPPGGASARASKAVLHLKMFSLKNVFIKKCEKICCFSVRHFGGQCSRFISNNTICAPPLLPQGGLQRAPKEGFGRDKNCLVGLWGAFGLPGPLLETFSGFLWSHLWFWKLSGILFGCIWALFGLLPKLFDIPWTHFS